MTNRSRSLALAASAALLLALSACSAGGASGAGRAVGGPSISDAAATADPSPSGPAGHADVFSLHPGDCLIDSGDTEVSELPVLDCSAPHDFEAFAEFDLAGAGYPGDEAVSAEAHSNCTAAFDPYVGIAYDASKLDVRFLAPTEESWSELDDRTVVCLVFDPSGPLTGSVQNARI
ncbi:septum formation family protein [Herbiconiux liangxiaofengii]|uniref:septum formation family protein n=1 Tax=Herbiconiux liangxiaofengii TaxID=3342795 RepID=UPI0035B741BB